MKAVLFDLDGTLADTEVLKAEALSLATKELGGQAEPEIYKSVMGQSWEAVTDYFFKDSGVRVSLDIFNPIFRKHYTDLIDNELTEARSAPKFLKFLKSKKIRMGLVSSASPWMIQKVLQKLEFQNSFEMIISSEDTELHKPHPEAYLKALLKMDLAAKEVVAFEDSESGCKAAAAANLKVFGVRHDFNERHDFALCEKTLRNFDECLEWEIFKKI